VQDHLNGAHEQHQQEDQTQQGVADPREQACSDQCADENAQRDRAATSGGMSPARNRCPRWPPQ